MTTSVAESAGEQSIRFQLVHAVRGRTRVRVTPPHLACDLARAFERILRDHPGVRDVRGNADSGSVVVTYDPNVLEIERLFAPLPEPLLATGLGDPLAHVRAVVTGWAEAVRRTPSAVLERGDVLWNATRDQMSAVISLWSANSVVARSSRLLQMVSSGSFREPEATSRK